MSRGAVRADLVVVGLGPAGARAAAVAAASGARVIAVDRREHAGRPVQCAELVPALLRQELALPRAVLRQTIARMRTFVEDAAPDDYAPFPGYLVDRAAFDHLLVERAREAGAECHFGCGISAVGPDGSVVTSAGKRLAAAVVIGADGPRSRIGKALGAANDEQIHARQITVPLLRAQDAIEIYLSAVHPGGYGWLFPRGAWAHLGVGVAQPGPVTLKALLAGLHARLVAAGRVGAEHGSLTGGLIPAGGPRRPWAAVPGTLLLLAGDAAGLTNPITGAGIHAAVVSGGLAGAAACAALDGSSTAGADYAEELETLFGPSLRRAGLRRANLLAVAHARRRVSAAELRQAWIAYPQYWAPAAARAPLRAAS